MRANILVALFSCLAGLTTVFGASSPPPASTAVPASTAAPGNSSATDADVVGLPPPGSPDLNSCGAKRQCPDKNSKCIDGNCLCNEGFIPIGNETCMNIPGAGDTCRINGQEFSCSGFGVDYSCPTNGTVCQCQHGYEPDKKGTCKAATKLVGAVCKVDGDCTAAFTSCQEGKCACIEGFKPDAKSSLCTPTEYKCLNNDKPLEEKGTAKQCQFKVNPETGDVGNDTCPSTHFCNSWQNSETADGSMLGHCCPKPSSANITATCPIGIEHKTGKCLDLSQFPADAPLPPDVGPLCPLGAYECTRGRVCCPLPCRSSNSFFNIDGKCYDRVILDQPCEHHAQCLPGAECAKGTCQCKTGYTKATPTLCLPPGQPSPPGAATP